MSSIDVYALIAMITFFQLCSINSSAGCSQCSWKARSQCTCKSRLDTPLRCLNLCYFLESGLSAIFFSFVLTVHSANHQLPCINKMYSRTSYARRVTWKVNENNMDVTITLTASLPSTFVMKTFISQSVISLFQSGLHPLLSSFKGNILTEHSKAIMVLYTSWRGRAQNEVPSIHFP